MTPTTQLFNSLRNTEPKFDYFTGMKPAEFLRLNYQIINRAIERCELKSSDIDLGQVAAKILAILPEKSYYQRPVVEEKDLFWGQFEQMGAKRDKKG